MVRTGLFRFVRHGEIEAYHRRGWMVTGDLGAVHGAWSVLCWACDCPAFRSLAADAPEPRSELWDVVPAVDRRDHIVSLPSISHPAAGPTEAMSWNSGRGFQMKAPRL